VRMNGVQRAVAVEKLFPSGVIAFEIRGGASPDNLFPAERACVARAVEGRVREFAAGRLCARAGIAALGLEPAPLLSRQDRAPRWPAGIVGSITHTHGYCIAAVGLEAQFEAIGLDAECTGRVDHSLRPLTMRAEEISRLEGLGEVERQQMTAVIFSAKEAFYKCQYALTRTWLGFEDVSVRVADDTFEVTVVEATHPIQRVRTRWIGRFAANDAFVVTGIVAVRPHQES
jgi:4'-phosphopantetheinyl transferase EntD